ncbi:cysteine-rich secretory protein 1-like [Discoglossus pictus]
MIVMNTISITFCLFAILPVFHGQVLKTATSIQKNRDEIIDTHNKFREEVSPTASDMMKMEWSSEAEINANQVARQCKFRHSSFSARTINSPSEMQCGENIFLSSHETNWKEVITYWNNEKDNFNFAIGPKKDSDVFGHYTQLVWNGSRLVGCGVAHCPKLGFLSVCQYCPPGNYMDRLYTPYTKGKPCATCPHSCEGKLCKKQA